MQRASASVARRAVAIIATAAPASMMPSAAAATSVAWRSAQAAVSHSGTRCLSVRHLSTARSHSVSSSAPLLAGPPGGAPLPLPPAPTFAFPGPSKLSVSADISPGAYVFYAVVALTSLLGGASIVHNIMQPDLTLPEIKPKPTEAAAATETPAAAAKK